jgi:hypothetical protein
VPPVVDQADPVLSWNRWCKQGLVFLSKLVA